MSQLTKIRKELNGSVYSQADTVRVIIVAHPLRSEKVEIRLMAGSSIAEIADQAASVTRISDLPFYVKAYIDGHVIEHANWSKVRPKAGTVIVLRAVAKGPLAPAIGAIFSAFSSAFASVATFIGGLGTFGQALLGLGLSLGAQFLMNALFPTRPPQLAEDTRQGRTAYSISGSRNEARPRETIPIVLGEHRVTPNFAATPYTDHDGSDEFFRGLYNWSYGPAFVTDIRIGETPISSYADVQMQHSNDFPPAQRGSLPLFPRQVPQGAAESVELETDLGWVTRTTATNVVEVSADIAFPQGIHAVSKRDGKKSGYGVTIRGRYREVNSPTWNEFPQMYVYANSIDPIRRTFHAYVPAGQYEIQVARITLPDRVYETDDWAVFSKTYFTAFRGVRPSAPITFPHDIVTTAVRIRASQQLNGALDQLNGIVHGMVGNGFNGTSWVGLKTSSNPADLVRHVLQGAANEMPVPDSEIDIPSLERWWRYCNAEGFRFDAIITTAQSPQSIVADICSAGRGAFVWRDGKWAVIYDEDSPIVQSFTPRNSWGFQSHKPTLKIPHAFRVRFINREKGYVEDERIVYDNNYNVGNATLFEEIEFPGVTSPHHAYRLAKYHIAQMRLRPETITLNVDWEGLVCTKGDRVRVQHDVMLVGQTAGRIAGYENNRLLLDEVVTVEAGKRYTLRWRAHDFSQHSVDFTNLAAGEYDSLPWNGSRPDDDVLFMWGELGKETAIYRILAMEPSENLSYRLTLVNDAPEIRTADSGPIPPFESNVTRPVDPFTLPPSDIVHSIEAYEDGGSWFTQLTFDWIAARIGKVSAFEVILKTIGSAAADKVRRVPASQRTISFDGLEDGIYRFSVRSIFENGTWSSWVSSEEINTHQVTQSLSNVQNFNIAVLGETSTLSWNEVAGANYYEIRHVPQDGVVTWNTATALQTNVSFTNIQVPTMVGHYLIKAFRSNGARSREATAIESNVAALFGLNVVETLTEDGFPGIKEKLEVRNGALRLRSKNVMANFRPMASASTMAGGSDGTGANVEVEGFYYFNRTLDLGAVFQSRLTAKLNASGSDLTNRMANLSTMASAPFMDNSEPEDWSVELQFRTTDSQASANLWGDWKPFVVGDVSARAFQFRLKLRGEPANMMADFTTVTPLVYGVNVTVDMEDRDDFGNDLPIPASGRTIVFKTPFANVPGVQIEHQNKQINDKHIINSTTEYGFFIQLYNNNNQPIAGNIDYQAKGYGYRT